jgi:hypothetical protein
MHYQDGQSEFDVVFTSEEGRFIGEIEGKDSKAINIDKLAQLNRNVGEDFARDEIENQAKGVLIGNAYRLHELHLREEFFTTKALSGAQQWNFALVRTPDLFRVVQYLRDNNDPQYARACRQSLADTEGAIVIFPTIPTVPRRAEEKPSVDESE